MLFLIHTKSEHWGFSEPQGPQLPQSGALPSQQEASIETVAEHRGGTLTLKCLDLEVTHVTSTYTLVSGTTHKALANCRGAEKCHLPRRLGRREDPDMQASNLYHNIYIRNYQKHKNRVPQTCPDENTLFY